MSRWQLLWVLVLVGALAGCHGAAEPKHASAKMGEVAKATDTMKDFRIDGFYVEACSCTPPCACEQTGADMTCKGVGAYQFDKGTYGGQDFSGTRVAYSLYIGEALHFYIDAPDAQKRAAAESFMRAALAGFGPVKGVHEAKVEISGKDGAHIVKVNGGQTMTFATEAMFGGDGKNPIQHENTKSKLNPTMMQGQCLSCTYSDAGMKITLNKGQNAYFNPRMKASGKL